MAADPRRTRVELATAELAADLKAWAHWAQLTGADGMPWPDEPQAAAATPSTRLTPKPRPQPAPGPPMSVEQLQHVAATEAVAERAPRPAGSEGLDTVRADLGDCRRCRLSQGRRNIVFGVGSPNAKLVLVGEAPGHYEDVTGEPFVGRSGQLLTRMMAAIGLSREEVYICNVLKCRPPNNRDPQHDEIASCSPFLERQVAAIAPRVIMTLGRFAGRFITGVEGPMHELRKQLGSYHQVPVVASYHPSYLLRTPKMKRAAWQDLLKVRALLRTQAPQA